MKISQSRIKSWNNCQQAYSYKYVSGLVPKAKSRPLEIGTLIHGMLHCKNINKDPFEWLEEDRKQQLKKNLFDEEIQLYEQCFQDVKLIMSEYFRYHKKDKWRIIKSEEECLVENAFGKDKHFIFYVDAIIKDTNGDLWLVEHKSGKREVAGETRLKDLQSALYLWGLSKMGIKVKGVIWNYITSSPIQAPLVLKNGSLSRNKSQRTTWYLYKKTLKELDLPIEDYSDMKGILENKELQFFNRIKLPVNKSMIKALVNNARVSINQFTRLEHKPTRSLGFTCNWCQYKELCSVDLHGGDIDEIIRASFTHREA